MTGPTEHSEFLASIIPPELALQISAQTGAGRKGGSTLKVLGSDPDLEAASRKDLNDDVKNGVYASVHSPTVLQANEINGILAELQKEVPVVVPQAKYVAGTTRIYVAADPAALMDMQTYKILDKNDTATNALAKLVISEGAFHNRFDPAQSLTTAERRTVIAHEYAHQLGMLNPDLANDQRFKPHSAQYEKEYAALAAKLKVNPLTDDEKQELNSSQPPL